MHQIDIANVHTCIGSSTETMTCNSGPCLIEGAWSSWESWGLCSRTCLNGTRNRLRHCRSTDQDQGGLYCPGNHLETSTCNQITCPVEKTCPDNWIVYHSSCYFFDHTATTFANAQRFCHSRNSSMVHIESVEENTFIVNHLQTFSNPGNGWWIGMTDSDVEGTWKWTDTNKLVNYTNWGTNEGGDVDGDCYLLYPSYSFKMADVGCTYFNASTLCELK
ncbi:perlucin-like protein isoform X2 [Ruditapes philippinarum]|uniref:perlucin-like protein isoform X2 n=1 Tax=Ruditapes philippinarum TaxID=129788 RepID=UPI00295AC519|nr:perlucin-like protein isoform X2 [Ruditapes philippinarum]